MATLLPLQGAVALTGGASLTPEAWTSAVQNASAIRPDPSRRTKIMAYAKMIK